MGVAESEISARRRVVRYANSISCCRHPSSNILLVPDSIFTQDRPVVDRILPVVKVLLLKITYPLLVFAEDLVPFEP